MLLIATVHNVVAIPAAVHNASLINHHLARCARVRTESRPALVLRIGRVGTTGHVLVPIILLVNLVQVLYVIEHLRYQLLILTR